MTRMPISLWVLGRLILLGQFDVCFFFFGFLLSLTASFSPLEINFMGYADPNQIGSGIRQRIYSRAFIVGSLYRPEERVVYLVLDTQSGDTAIRHGILEGLSQLGDEYAIYNSQNVAVSGTHSHSGPGAFLNYLLPQITSKGFDKQSYQAIVDGAVLSIKRAHEMLTPGNLEFGTVDVQDANINRSPYAYLANPAEEREQYADDVDKAMSLLKFIKTDGKAIAALTFFPVHGTSMLGNNTLITGDNKGVAAYLLEERAKDDPLVADSFVAGFSQSNVGDTSPNVLGAFCEDGSGLECDFKDSTCGGKTQACHGRGPFFREEDQGGKSCFEIGRRQFLAAWKLFAEDSGSLRSIRKGKIGSFHRFQDLAGYNFTSPFNSSQALQTCSAALGYSFAAGTTDGPGAFDFTQNNTDSPSAKNPLWRAVRSFLHEPSEEQVICQAPKPVLLDVGSVERPYAWTPNIVDIQMLRIGDLFVIVSPGEATTMSGRRWKSAIASAAQSQLGIEEPRVVLGGPANTYAHYIATPEEYTVQRYEGASTLYGPNTLAAYINLTVSHLHLLDESKSMPPLGPAPPINTNRSYNFINPVILDRAPFLKSFGDVVTQPETTFVPGETVCIVFVGANPRNDLRLEGSFAVVERRIPRSTSWEIVRHDGDWSLTYRWERKSTLLGTSEVTIEWAIETPMFNQEGEFVPLRRLEPQSGFYRIKYFGNHKGIGGSIEPFEGVSNEFRVEV